MITRQNIASLYKQFANRPESADMLDMPLLFDATSEHHGVYVDPDTQELVISSIVPSSPFHAIRLDKINAIVPFDEWVAIVLHSSIIFLNKESSKVAIDIKPVTLSFSDRLRGAFSGVI